MQKKVGDALYVLDLTPYVITEDTDVSIIYVQNEKIKEYKELNTELASKMHGFNQFIMTVLPRPWADGGDDPGPDPGQTGHTLTVYWDPVFSVNICGRVDSNGALSNEGGLAWVEFTHIDEQGQTIGYTHNNVPAGWHFQYDERNFPMGWQPDPYLEIDHDDTLWDIGTTWIMPDSDTTMRLVGHAVKLLGYDIHDHVNVNINGDDVDYSAEQWTKGVCPGAGARIKITPKEGLQPSWFNVIQGVEWDENEQAWVATMPDSDLVIQIDYAGQPQPRHTLTVNWDSTFAAQAKSLPDIGVVGRCDSDNKPALVGDTGYYNKEYIYDEQNPPQWKGFIVNDMPEGCQFEFDERWFPTKFNLTSSPVLEHGTDELAGLGQTYVMPASDVTVSLTVQEATGHTLTLDGSDIHSHVDVYFNNEQVQTTIEYNDVAAGTEIQIKPEQGALPSWYGVIQGVEWDDNAEAWVATMPNEDYRISINYDGQPQVAAYWGYNDNNGQHRWEHQYFVKNPRVFLPDSDQDWVSTSQWLYPADEYDNMIPINSSEGLTVSSITSSNPLVTFDDESRPIVSRDSNNELPYGDVTITATIHDNSGTYTDSTISYTLRLVNTYKLTIDAYNNPDTGEPDPSSASTSSDYIRGDFEYGIVEQHRMIRCGSSEILIDSDLVPYVVGADEYIDLGFPARAEVKLWFDGMASDIDTVYSVDSGEEITELKEDHWITFVMPESPVNMQAHWNTNSINQIAFNDTDPSHNGSNIDEDGERYYSIKLYGSAPASYTNEIIYGYRAAGGQYGPSDFTFSVANSHGQSVELTDQGAGLYSFSMNSDNTPETFTITITPTYT